MTNDPDPVGDWFRRQPGAPWRKHHRTVHLSPEVSGKRLEILREVVPKLSRVAVLGSSTAPGYAQTLKEIELAAKAFRMQLQFLDITHAKDIETAFRAASKGRAQGVFTLDSPITFSASTDCRLAVKKRLPVMYPGENLSKTGGLCFTA